MFSAVKNIKNVYFLQCEGNCIATVRGTHILFVFSMKNNENIYFSQFESDCFGTVRGSDKNNKTPIFCNAKASALPQSVALSFIRFSIKKQ